jgi:hypothetical protein
MRAWRTRCRRAWLVLAGAGALVLANGTHGAAQSLTFTPLATIPGPADLVRAQGSVLLVGVDKTITIYDVADPAAPKRLAAYEFPGEIWGFRVEGSRLYAATGHSGLGILDISKPSAPRLVSLFKTPGQAKNVSVTRTRAVVANHNSGVDFIDITDETKPSLIGSTDLDGYARDVAIHGTIAVAVDNPTGVYLFDIAKVTESDKDPIASVQNATAPQLVEIAEVGPGRTPIAVLGGNEQYDQSRTQQLPPGARPRSGSIQVYDISNPRAPQFRKAHPTTGGGRKVSVKGSLVYVADGSDGVRVLDLSDPSKGVEVAAYKTPKGARDVAVIDSLVFVVVGGGGPRAGAPPGEHGDVLVLRQQGR